MPYSSCASCVPLSHPLSHMDSYMVTIDTSPPPPISYRYHNNTPLPPQQQHTEQPSAAVSRGLVLATKLIQGIVNQTPFEKETYMVPFNDMVESYCPKLEEFFSSILVSGTTTHHNNSQLTTTFTHRYQALEESFRVLPILK